MKTAVMPDSIEGLEQLGLCRRSNRESCARRLATSRATGPRATPRADCTSICRS